MTDLGGLTLWPVHKHYILTFDSIKTVTTCCRGGYAFFALPPSWDVLSHINSFSPRPKRGFLKRLLIR